MKISNLLILSAFFASGVLFKTAMDAGGFEFVQRAYAEVAGTETGMEYIDLRRDKNFRRAVEYIVERCKVNGDEIDC